MLLPLLPPKRRLLLTSSRKLGPWDIPFIKRKLVPFWRPRMILVQGYARGGDKLAREIWKGWGGEVEDHPVSSEEWDRVGLSAGHKRNEYMVSLGADLCVALPKGESPGTRGCEKFAKAAEIPTYLYEYEPRVFILPAMEEHLEDW